MILVVARRELVERARTRGFQLSMFALAAVVAGAIALSQLVNGTPRTYAVGATPGTPAATLAAATRTARAGGVTLRWRSLTSAGVAPALRAAAVSAVLAGRERVIVRQSLDPQLGALLQAALLSSGQGKRMLPSLSVSILPGGQAARDATRIAIGAAILLYIALVFTGAWVSTGIVEEKSSRVAEVMLAAVRPSRLLAGKLLGIGLVAAAQVAVVALTAVVTARVAGAPAMLHGVTRATPIVAGWFVLGYALFAFAFACAASLVARQEDLPAVTMPLNAVTAAAFFSAMEAAQHPDGALGRVLSLLPPFSALLMPVRLIDGGVPGWQVAVALVAALAALAGVVALATRVYANSLLHGGGRRRLRAALG